MCGNCLAFVGARASMIPHNTMARVDPAPGSADHPQRERYTCTVCGTGWIRYCDQDNVAVGWVVAS